MLFSDWFIAADTPPVYTGFYECVYDGDPDSASVMRWFDATTGKYYCVNEITGEAMLQRQACFGWGQDKWRGMKNGSADLADPTSGGSDGNLVCDSVGVK